MILPKMAFYDCCFRDGGARLQRKQQVKKALKNESGKKVQQKKKNESFTRHKL